MEAIKKFSNFHPLVQRNAKGAFFFFFFSFLFFPLSSSLHFCWVPFHVGIHSNEVADREVKIAARSAGI